MKVTPAQKEARETLAKIQMCPVARRRELYIKYNKQEAQAHGQRYYWRGKTCRNGHNDFRFTNGGACASCVKQKNARYKREKLNAGAEGIVDNRLKLDRLLDEKRTEKQLDMWL